MNKYSFFSPAHPQGDAVRDDVELENPADCFLLSYIGIT
jgi:hypothetical protein